MSIPTSSVWWTYRKPCLAGNAEEENFFGRMAAYEPTAERASHTVTKSKLGERLGWQISASGHAGVWVSENTREAIRDAMARKEIYATTGPPA